MAEVRYQAERRTRAALDEVLDVVITSLIDRRAVRLLVDDIVEYIAVQPAVRDLVQSQGAHLTDEVIDETGQDLFRADTLGEHLVSSARRRLHFDQRRRHSSPKRPR
jgi:hypothetical protein